MWKIRPVFILLLSLIVPTYVHAERITDFAAAVTVHTDNSVFVSETIHYDSEGLEKHGLLRIIRAVSAEGRRMNIDSISVVDDAGNPYMFDVERNGSSVTVKIGNPNVTFVGEKTYVIQYSATNAVTHLTDKDEIYWNVTGNSWPFSIENATAIVTPPDDAEVTASACYVGSEGSTEECARHNNTSFVAGKTLTAGEGFTIAVGFPEGIVAPYPPKTWMERNGYLFLFLLPLIIFFILFRRWKRYGKDPKGTGVIVPQYDVLDDLTPMEVALIVYQKNRNKDIAAELIYLATKGYLKIHQTQTKTFGVFKSTDYELTLLKSCSDIRNDFDCTLLLDLFSGDNPGTVVSLSSFKNTFFRLIPKLFNAVGSAVLSKQYYKTLPQSRSMKKGRGIALLAFVVAVAVSIIFTVKTSVDSLRAVPALIVSITISIILLFVFESLMPAKTEKGVAAKEYILGLKDYLQIAEKDRLKFHNAPEKKPEVFEHLLPYALVLGVENSWAKEFSDLYMVPPSWYEGTYDGAFNAYVFTHSLSSFSTNTTAVLGSAPNSGGSGGGGFSGGGGGGGGGGSW